MCTTRFEHMTGGGHGYYSNRLFEGCNLRLAYLQNRLWMTHYFIASFKDDCVHFDTIQKSHPLIFRFFKPTQTHI